MDKRAGVILVTIAVVVAILFSIIASYRDLTGLENVLLQVFSLGIGLIGSYVLGRESAREAAREFVKPHARSAFRRLLSLYRSLSRLALAIQAARPINKSDPMTSSILDKLEGIVIEQIATADDALEDWRDIVPEDVQELRAQLAPKGIMEDEK
jgi:hypothetical protein